MSDCEIASLIADIERLAETQDWTELDRRVGDFAEGTPTRKVAIARQAIAQRLQPEFQPDRLELGKLRNEALRRSIDMLTTAERSAGHIRTRPRSG
jgi:hypothetical protein